MAASVYSRTARIFMHGTFKHAKPAAAGDAFRKGQRRIYPFSAKGFVDCLESEHEGQAWNPRPRGEQ